MDIMEEETPSDSVCLVCDIKLGRTARGVNIFEETNALPYSHEHISGKLSGILGTSLNNEAVSDTICKKCYKLLEAVDGLEWSLQEHRAEINTKYKRSCQARIINSDNHAIETKDELPFLSAFNDEENEGWNGDDVPDIENGELYLEMDAAALGVAELEEDTKEKVHEFLETRKDERSLKEKFLRMKTKRKMNLTKKRNLLKPFCCPVCQKRFSYKRYVTEHVRCAHKNEKIYKCEACKKSFRYKKELTLHVIEHERDVDPKFECELCGKKYQLHKQFQEHKRFHESKVHSCELCEKVFSSSRLLEEHMNVHTGARPHVCHLCSKSFASSQCYRVHVKTHDDRERPHQCHLCSKSFMKAVHLQGHMKTHNPEGEFQCNLCGRKFNTKRSLDCHAVVHSTERPFVCRTCGKSFTRKSQLRIHERIHTGVRPYVCDICGTAFAQHSNLSTHKKLTHEQLCKFRCPHCNKPYKRRRLVKWHIMAAHTGEKPLVCQTCGAGFVYPEHLKKHMRIHTGEKPYSCRTCGRTFSSKENRDMHEFIHTDIKPYQCAICSQGFMRKPLLLAHITSVHHIEGLENHIVRNNLTSEHLKDIKVAKFKPQVLKSKEMDLQVSMPPASPHQQLPHLDNMGLDMHGQYQMDQSQLTAGKLHYVFYSGALQDKANKNYNNQMVMPGGTVLMPAVGHQQLAVPQHESQYIQVQLPKGFAYGNAAEYTN